MSRKDLIESYKQRRAGFKAEIDAIKAGVEFKYSTGAGGVRFVQYGDYTPEKRQRLAQEKAAHLADYDRTFIMAQFSQDKARYEKLAGRRREIIAANRLNDPLADKPGLLTMGMAELEGLAGKVRTLRDFEQAYESSGDNPGLRRAYQLKGASLALARWRDDSHNGAFAKRLESDLAAAFESAESLKMREELQALHGDTVELAQTARQIGREGATSSTLFELDNLGSLSREVEELSWAIAAAANGDTGESGGVFSPAGMGVTSFGGQPAPAEG